MSHIIDLPKEEIRLRGLRIDSTKIIFYLFILPLPGLFTLLGLDLQFLVFFHFYKIKQVSSRSRPDSLWNKTLCYFG